MADIGVKKNEDEKKLQIAQITKHGSTIGLGLLYDGELLPCQTGELGIKTYSNSYASVNVNFSICNSAIGIATYEITEQGEGEVKSS